ncbi:OmpH family outer membrane protein [Dyella sp. A6]|uniref:OmpH family outer membrane protein n=1 Tax=Dyella aluminiiresistens TaxID=3069105 RepID=UPI002E76EC6A|nr:OmpH family outer membrane protein [Dyella sp. A6]
MNLHRPLLTAALLTVAGLAITPVAPVHAAAATKSLGGSPVPGVCMLSREAIFAEAKVGKAASQRLAQLAQQARAQLETERQPLDADVQAFQKKAASMSPAQRKQDGEALQQRMQAFQTQAGELNERIQLTRAKVMQRIGQDAEPAVASAYTAHHCGLLLDRDSVLGGNTSNDITAEVIQGLDRRTSTITFNLEPLPSKSGK